MIRPMEHKVARLGVDQEIFNVERACDVMSEAGWRLVSTYAVEGNIYGIFRRPRK